MQSHSIAGVPECRDHQAWAAEKSRRFDRGDPIPHDWHSHG
jgi:hypothetical protein